jgi:hypothetical protein
MWLVVMRAAVRAVYDARLQVQSEIAVFLKLLLDGRQRGGAVAPGHHGPNRTRMNVRTKTPAMVTANGPWPSISTMKGMRKRNLGGMSYLGG